MKQVLLIAYYFPPTGGAGVQRPAKFVKYLPQFTWMPTVLTCSDPSAPVADPSLVDGIPEGVQIMRARTLEPGYRFKQAGMSSQNPRDGGTVRDVARKVISAGRHILQPDPQVLWFPAAYSAASNLIRSNRYAAIMVTAPPYSAFLMGERLARKFNLPLVCDYRDEWQISQGHLENASRGKIARKLQAAMEARVLKTAAAVIGTTQASADSLRQRAASFGATPDVHCIYNGWDPDDFSDATAPNPASDPNNIRIVYTGTLWKLTDISPLVEAVRHISMHKPELLCRLVFEFIGRKTAEQAALLQHMGETGCRVESKDYVPHDVAVEAMVAADALLLTLADTPESHRVVPGKFFEYLATGRPLVAIVPPGECRELVEAAGGRVLNPQDPGSIADCLEILATRRDTESLTPPPEFRERFTRQNQAGELARILDSVVR